MAELKRIHPDYSVYFQTFGKSVQSRVTILSPRQYDHTSNTILVEPGRTIIIGDIDDELRELISGKGKPVLNELTYTPERPGGIFSSRAYAALIDHLYDNDDPEKQAPRIRRKMPSPVLLLH